jgi:gas vesicle protein
MRILMTRKRAGFALPLATMLGAAIGAVTALLIAPTPGAGLRRQLLRRGGKVAGRVIGEGREAMEKCGSFLREQGNGALARLH